MLSLLMPVSLIYSHFCTVLPPYRDLLHYTRLTISPLSDHSPVYWTRGISLGFSWLARIHTIKMTLLPKPLYAFQVLPVSVPPHILHSLQCHILKFWGSTRQRLNQVVLYKQKCAGGLGVPNLIHYYKPAQIAPLIQLFAGESSLLWTCIILVDVDSIPLLSLLWLPAHFHPKL